MKEPSVPRDPARLLALARERLEKGRPRRALRYAEEALARDAGLAAAHYALGLALTLLGRIRDADRAFGRAAELDPEHYFLPCRLGKKAFDRVVERALEGMPRRFREYLENVEIGVEAVPTPDMLAEGLEFDLLGVYIGDTVGAEEWGFPDRIVLFQRNLENISPDHETLLVEIRDTLLHEVGHHFGMEEDELREIESESESP